MARLLDEIEEGVLILHKALGKLRSRIGVVAARKDFLDEKIRVRRISKILNSDVELVEGLLRERLRQSRKRATRSQGVQTDVRKYVRPSSPSPTKRNVVLQPAWCPAVTNNRKAAISTMRRKDSPKATPRRQTTSKSVQVSVTHDEVSTQTDVLIDTQLPAPVAPILPAGFQCLPVDCLFEIIDFLHTDTSFLDILCVSRSTSRTALRVLGSKKHLLVDNRSTWNLLQKSGLVSRIESTMLHVDINTMGMAEEFLKSDMAVEKLKFLQLVPKGIHVGELTGMGVHRLMNLRWLDTQLDVMECKRTFFENFPNLEGCLVRRFSTPINSLSIPAGHPLCTLLYCFNNPVGNSDTDVVLPAQVRALGIFESADILPVSGTLQIIACRLHAAIDLLDTVPQSCPSLQYLVILTPINPTGSTKHLLEVVMSSCAYSEGRQIKIVRATESDLLKRVCQLIDRLPPEM